jgi:general secretion pathway protein N
VKYLKYGFIAAVCYAVFLVALLPASFVISKIPAPRGLILGAAQGTVWQGKLDFVRYQGVTLTNVTWQLLFGSLLQGQLVVDTKVGSRTDDIRGGGELGYSLAGVLVNDFKLTAPLSVIGQIQPLPLGLKATGTISLNLANYTQAKPWCESLSGNINLDSANISSSLGSVDISKAKAVISCDAGDVVALIKPATNSLGINAKVRLDRKRQLKVTGYVKPPANAPRDFVELLKFTGQANAQGRYALDFTQAM